MITISKFYITTPIYYANDKLHIGHATSNVIADVLARWHRLIGDDVFFVTGSDEHGEKIEKSAAAAGMQNIDFVDYEVRKFKELWQRLNISNDCFIRTTEKAHEEAVKAFIEIIGRNQDIYKAKYSGWYCVHEETFWTELELKNGKCPECGREVKILEEDAYFFRLGKYQGRLLEFYNKNSFVLPPYRQKEMFNRIAGGLRDISITRPSVKWAIKFPLDQDQYIYVWVDALVNYLSALGWPNGANFKRFWPPDVHVIGKDINWFHSVVWPALLMSSGLQLPSTILATGFWTVNNEKMSKSKGNVVDPIALIDKYSADALRYFLIREKGTGEDGSFSEDAFIARINGELVADLGNLVYRVLTLAEKAGEDAKFEGRNELGKKLEMEKLEKSMEGIDINSGLNAIWQFIREANKYVNENKAWALHGAELSNALYNLLEACRVISILIYPFMPETGEKIAAQLGAKIEFRQCAFSPDGKFSGKIKKGGYLFKKIKV
ncbi:MAG: methionine--tRNA ligase [Candidatus Marsarchaeota archaeon]|nr:methionine--tRNA ligase [Candidatus Marsarchaeota archaeon]MCL5105854.1 methionine--tRNA ligase [Candidatus Marsarchaeota archaeon]